jgi:hypothetical protein
MIELPRELLWDYQNPPADELWRLQRLADFFPQFGRDRASVRALMRRLPELKVPPEVAELIRLYAQHYDGHH